MPITSELDNLKKLESVGFSHEQAEALADVIEKSHVDSQENLKEFIQSEIRGSHKELASRITDLSKELDNRTTGLSKELDNRTTGLSKELDSRITGLSKELDSRITGLSKELDSKITGLSKELDGNMSNLHLGITSEINKELKDLLIKIFGIIVGTVGIAVTILKLFP